MGYLLADLVHQMENIECIGIELDADLIAKTPHHPRLTFYQGDFMNTTVPLKDQTGNESTATIDNVLASCCVLILYHLPSALAKMTDIAQKALQQGCTVISVTWPIESHALKLIPSQIIQNNLFVYSPPY